MTFHRRNDLHRAGGSFTEFGIGNARWWAVWNLVTNPDGRYGCALIPMAIPRAVPRGCIPLAGGIFPTRLEPKLDPRLINDAVIFGIGWGLVGLCPDPALVSLNYRDFLWVGPVYIIGNWHVARPHALGLLDKPASGT
jgi:uncharacterized membrane protein YedE/YeeE